MDSSALENKMRHSMKKEWQLTPTEYRRGNDRITRDVVSIGIKDYTPDELRALEARIRAVRRAYDHYFPKGK